MPDSPAAPPSPERSPRDRSSRAQPAAAPVTANQQAAQSTAPNADYEKRLRSVKAFLDGPLFKDLSEQPVVVAESSDAIEERKRDLDHRIHVAKSLIALLEQDKAALDALESAQKAGGQTEQATAKK
jgi:hypothetical protein